MPDLTATIALGLIVAALIVIALRSVIRTLKSGGCSCGCVSGEPCNGDCENCSCESCKPPKDSEPFVTEKE